MVAFASHWERMRLPDDQGKHTRFHTLRLFEKRTGKRHPDLDGPPEPAGLLYVYDWWRELDDARAMGYAGQQPISFSEIASWAAMTRRRPTAEEVHLLRRIDKAHCRLVAEDAARRRQAKPKDKGHRR